MHSSSDIFCFKDPKTGESDGSEIYAVDGSCFSSCFSKTQKHRQPTSEAFQFANANQQGRKQKEIGGIVGEEDLDELCQLARIETQQPVVSRSSMKRNFITGAGLEDEKVSQKRHFKAAYNEHPNGLFGLTDIESKEVQIENVDEDCEEAAQNGDVTDAGFAEDEELEQRDDCNEAEVEISEAARIETGDSEKRTVTIARNFLTGEGLEDDVRLSQRKHFEAVDIDDSDQMSDIEDPNIAKVTQKIPEGLVSPSSIKRNFLTGAGLEDDKVTQRKHCPQKVDKWIW